MSIEIKKDLEKFATIPNFKSPVTFFGSYAERIIILIVSKQKL